MYYTGRGKHPVNKEKAEELFQQARKLATIKQEESLVDLWEWGAVKGENFAQERLGEIYELGVGVARDLAKALKYYESAASQGNTKAQEHLRRLID
jgi:TPR repeat protein